jgi:FkbM family methyltransferase
MIRTITDHTVETDFLKPGSWALDAGCLGFEFTNVLLDMGLKVIALDPGEEMPPARNGLVFLKAALVGDHFRHFKWQSVPHSPTDSHLVETDYDLVKTYTILELMQEYNIEQFSLVKLDIEGSEYDVLTKLPGPISKQFSIEFHLHVWEFFAKSLSDAEWQQLLAYEHLVQWYEPRVYSRTKPSWSRHENYCDALFVAKGVKS